MNKVLNINLGSAPFVIDENAYEALANYLNGLRKHFSGSEGCEEIVADIEARIAELFADYLKNRQIVTLADVKRAIGVMGIPTDIDNNTNTADQNTGANGGYAGSAQGNWQAGKRLFRNEDDKVIGGVCSGLAAYLGFTDPLWMRLAWAALFFISGGAVILIYLLLLVIVPKALTAADKLAMRGENVNVDNIAKTVEQELGSIGQRLGNFGTELGETLGGKKHNGDSTFGTARTGSYSSGGDILVTMLKGFVKVVLLFSIGIALITLIGTWIGFIIAGVQAYPYTQYFIASPTAAYVGWGALMIALIVPIAALILAIVRIFYKNLSISSMAAWGMGLTWLGSLLTLIVIGTTIVRDFALSDTSTRNIALNNPNAETISIEFKKDDSESMDLSFGNMKLRGDQLVSNDIELDIEQSPDAQFHLIQKNTSRASNAIDARRSADQIEYLIAQTDSSLLFDPLLTLPKGEKCRWQDVKLTLQVPVGKKIKVKNVEDDKSNFDDYTDDIYLMRTESCKDDDSDNDPREVFMYKARTWRMTQNGLVCDNCTPEELKQFDTQKKNDWDDENKDNDKDTEESISSEDADAAQAAADADTIKSINISGDNAKLEVDKNGLRLKAKDKESGDDVEVKINEDGIKVKKNGKIIKSTD
jgi:phage shock protein PspC (stress-responsive transcriptional regulator)